MVDRMVAFRRVLTCALAAAAPALLVVSCAYDHQKGSAGQVQQPPPGSASPSFAQVRDQVFTPSCTTCHKHDHSYLTQYASAFDKRAEIQSMVFVEKSMPENGSLSSAQMTLLNAWLQAGAPEQSVPAGSPPPAPTPTSVTQGSGIDPTWANVQSHFLGKYCARCHSGDDPDGDLDVTSLDQVHTHASPILNHVFVKRDMPRSAAARALMTVESLDLLVNWVDLGMPDANGVPWTPPSPTPSPMPSQAPSPAPSIAPPPSPTPAPTGPMDEIGQVS